MKPTWSRKLRWRRVGAPELYGIVEKLLAWDSPAGGAARHQFVLSSIESFGPEPLRLVHDSDRFALAVVFPGRLLAPVGHSDLIRRAGAPGRRWRLLVGDRAAGDAVLASTGRTGLVVLDQRFLSVEAEQVPQESEVADPGLRRAEPADLDQLARLAVQLHIDDGFGPDPGEAGWLGYRQRLQSSVSYGQVYCVGPVGAPVFKIERSVSSQRHGVQLAGIVAEKSVRGQGIGTGAVATAVRSALADVGGDKPVTLHVGVDNLGARKVYGRAGFVDREPWRLAVRSSP